MGGVLRNFPWLALGLPHQPGYTAFMGGGHLFNLHMLALRGARRWRCGTAASAATASFVAVWLWLAGFAAMAETLPSLRPVPTPATSAQSLPPPPGIAQAKPQAPAGQGESTFSMRRSAAETVDDAPSSLSTPLYAASSRLDAPLQPQFSPSLPLNAALFPFAPQPADAQNSAAFAAYLENLGFPNQSLTWWLHAAFTVGNTAQKVEFLQAAGQVARRLGKLDQARFIYKNIFNIKGLNDTQQLEALYALSLILPLTERQELLRDMENRFPNNRITRAAVYRAYWEQAQSAPTPPPPNDPRAQTLAHRLQIFEKNKKDDFKTAVLFNYIPGFGHLYIEKNNASIPYIIAFISLLIFMVGAVKFKNKYAMIIFVFCYGLLVVLAYQSLKFQFDASSQMARLQAIANWQDLYPHDPIRTPQD